ncbi:MAG TPA: tetratricopeptide repeat protein [Ktedonobacteraceae bacterium]
MAQEPWNVLIRLARQRLEMTQADFAEYLEVPDDGTVSRWERGKHIPDGKHQRMLRERFPDINFAFPPPVGKLIWNVPYKLNPFFTGRDTTLQELHTNLQKGTPTALTQAIRGLGGIGKTQTASEYAHHYQSEYDAVLWLRATPEHYLTDLLALASLLQLPEAKKTRQELQVLIHAVLRWLQKHTRWLLILDNVQEEVELGDWLSATGTGHILYTTRSRAIADRAHNIELAGLPPEEGALLLLRVARILAPPAPLEMAAPADRDIAIELASLMGGLPLALELAGAYIHEMAYTLARYREEYLHEQERRVQMLAYTHSGPREYSDYPESVATTWALSFRRVKEQNPAAIDLLQFCAFLSPDAIPESLILQGASALTPLLHPLARNLEGLNRALIPLLNYSLLKRQADQSQLAMHRLVQEVVRHDLADLSDLPERDQVQRRRMHQRQWAKRTVEAVTRVFLPAESGSLRDYDQYVPHVLACMELISGRGLLDGRGLVEEAASRLLLAAGNYWRRRAWFEKAEEFCLQALKMDEEVLGLYHPKVAKDWSTLGLVYDDKRKHTQAERCHQHALEIIKRIYPPIDPDRGRVLINLARCYYYLGRLPEAEPLLRDAHAILAMAEGPEAQSTLDALSWLATIYREWARYPEAEQFYQFVLALFESNSPPQQEVLASCIEGLAGTYELQGKLEEAFKLRQRTLALLKESVGREHPDVALCLTGLADNSIKLNKLEDAEEYSREALAIYEQTVGYDHSDIAQPIGSLAIIATLGHQYAEAEALFQQSVAIIEQIQGPEHPDLGGILDNYAMLLRLQNRTNEAVVLEERVRAIEAKTSEPRPSE